ncbi:MAG: oligosaccharide flippase family protein, partial [Rhodospirillales bacterium]|nr:oligosaccharide flippase family protein [Rhodospirillales bacterium]
MSETGMSASGSILARTAKGAGWVIAWRMLTRTLGLISTLILVRLLLPGDFGLVMLATGFGQALGALSELGVEEAVIRVKSPTRELYDTAFTINVIRGLATCAVVAAGAWPAGIFFDDMRLVPVMVTFAAGGVIGSFENIGIVDFRRDIAFEKEFLLMSVPRLASVAVAIGTAFLWRSYWALVAAMLVSGVLRTALGYVIHPFRPRFGLSAWRQIAGFSVWSWMMSILGLVRDRMDSFVIGRLLGVTEVGLYSVGTEIATLPASELIAPLARACFSGFAAARHADEDGQVMRDTYVRVIGGSLLVSLPAGVGISLVADPVVKLALGLRWAAATPLVEVLGVAMCVTAVGYISSAMLNAHGILRRLFVLQVVTGIIRVLLVLPLVWRFGLLGAALAGALATVIEHLGYLTMTMRHLALPWWRLLAHLWRTLAASAAMAGGLWALGLGWNNVADAPAATRALLAAVPLGASFYVAAVLLLWVAAGRPDGPERDALAMAGRVWRGGAARLLRRLRMSARG